MDSTAKTTTEGQDLGPSAIPAYETNKYLWGLRFIQVVFAVIIVGLTGSAISDWQSFGCSTPGKLGLNFAVVFLPSSHPISQQPVVVKNKLTGE
jgi:hypothetical protein